MAARRRLVVRLDPLQTMFSIAPCPEACETRTWMYSMTLSSPSSLFGLYLVAGKAFGEMFSSVRPRALVMLQAATETAAC
jgi:hypothetical protein